MISGFSKLSKQEKTEILKQSIPLNETQMLMLNSFHHSNKSVQNVIDEMSENIISNYSLPFSIAPNFRINNKFYLIPMVTEESSVVAATSNAAKFWATNGGFKSRVIGTKKNGQIYFNWNGDVKKLQIDFPRIKDALLAAAIPLLKNMEKRGGGISDISLTPSNPVKNDYFVIHVGFETVDSMGANFINSCLEIMGTTLTSFLDNEYPDDKSEIIMAILSNYTTDCIVECYVECDILKMSPLSGTMSPKHFTEKFAKAVQIANENTSRAVTHNKGIFNGIDAVLTATGNDTRAAEANGHAYAAKDGTYKALTQTEIDQNKFKYILRMPLAVGTVGGAISMHPLAKTALQILQNPNAEELMQIVSAVGLASNFAAIHSLITEGIQKGHMKLHLNNILYQLNTTDNEKSDIKKFFINKQVSFKAVSDYLENIRK